MKQDEKKILISDPTLRDGNHAVSHQLTINNIIKIMDAIGIDQLSGDLQEIAQLRIQHPDYSIQQLAESLSQPITKSGVNHRLRKLNKIAEEL